MQFFTLKLSNPNKFEYLPQIPIFFENNNTMIGVCHVKEDERGIIGEFRLEADLTTNYYVVCQFHVLQITREFLTAIILKAEFENAKTIQDLMIQ